MDAAIRKQRFRRFAPVVWLVLMSGCSSIQVPKIDPTGERVFLPTAHTTLTSPCEWGCHASSFQPAFREPPSVPPCPIAGPGRAQPVAPPPAPAAVLANVPERLIVTPSKLVAPVGSEVVLLAGLSGTDGQFQSKQPMDWILSQESVGHFVDVGEDHHGALSQMLHKNPKKLSSNLAVGRTATQARMITRGTAVTSDDLWLQKGQAWVSLTSPSEGTSHVTAVVTGADNWDQRRQTAMIQWVDAQWVLPPPAIARAGQSHALTTTVNRSTTGAPVPNWLVRYSVLSGPPVGFGPQQAASIEVPTDGNGQASVSVQPRSNAPGVTQIQVEILSPHLSGLDGQPVVVGQSTTTITWSAAGLGVRILGPPTGPVDSTLTYQIEVSNPGDLPAQNVVVTVELPRLLRPLATDGVQGGSVQFRLDSLAPRSSHNFTLACRAVSSGSVRLFVRAQANGIQAEPAHFDTQIVESALRLTMQLASDPNLVRVGSRVTFNVLVTNAGNIPMTNVQLRDTYDPGLEEVHGEASPIVKLVGNLAPGASQPIAVTFLVRQAGELCHAIEAWADGGHTASARECIRAQQSRYELSLELSGPQVTTVGQTAQYEIVVTNNGDSELTGIRILYRGDNALLPRESSPGIQRDPADSDVLFWELPSLRPGESQSKRILCSLIEPREAAEIRVSVSSVQGLTQAKSLFTAIRPASAGAAPPTSQGPGAQPPGNGTLTLSVADTADPIKVGESTVYIIEIENGRPLADKNLQVSFFLSDGLKFVRLNREMQVRADGKAVAMQPIVELRAGERFPAIRLEVQASAPGVQWVRTEVTSQLSEQAIVQTHETRVDLN